MADAQTDTHEQTTPITPEKKETEATPQKKDLWGIIQQYAVKIVGSVLILGAATLSTCGSDYAFRRDEHPLKSEGSRAALRSEVYKDRKHDTWRVDYAAHGVMPPVSYTCDDQRVLDAAVMFAENEAPFHLCKEKNTLLDRIVEEKRILDLLSGKDRHLTLEDAKKARVNISDYVKHYNKGE